MSSICLEKIFWSYVELFVLIWRQQNIGYHPEVKVSPNGPERRSGKIIIAGTAFRLEFLVAWYYDADATTAVPELY